MQPVEVAVTACEGAGAAQVGVHDAHRDARGVERGAVAADACVPEAVHGVAWLERLAPARGDGLVALDERDRVLAGTHGVQVSSRQIAVGADVFAVVDDGAGAGRTEVVQGDPAGGVLAEVGDPDPVLQLFDGSRRTGVDDAYGRCGRPVDRGSLHLVDEDRSFGPRLAAEVGGLPVHEVGPGDGRPGTRPGLVGAHDLACAVLVRDVQLGPCAEHRPPFGRAAERPTWPRYQPSERTISIRLPPSSTAAVTSDAWA